MGLLFHDFDIKYSKHSDTGITKKKTGSSNFSRFYTVESTDALSKCAASGVLLKESNCNSPGLVVVLADDLSDPDPDPDPSDQIEEMVSRLKLFHLPHHTRAR